MNNPGFLIAGTHSGCGKTTVSMGLMRAFADLGLQVQPWKAGPDYIDPKFHTIAARRSSRNLDTMLCSPDTVKELYARQQADLSIVEGVMGFFDGAGPCDERGSSAHLAKLLGLPVILVLDARAMARSAAAIVKGFATFDPELELAGIILNRVGSPRHARVLGEAIREYTGIPVIGSIPKDARMALESRHLGLVPAEESEHWDHTFDTIAGVLKEHLDLGRLRQIAAAAGQAETGLAALHPAGRITCHPRIGIADDAAFNFYYQDNLDLLEDHGAELVRFSPVNDHRLPDSLDALYLGGGYPELHAGQLSANTTMKDSIRQAVEGGMPLLAECGGFMYLCDAIEVDGHSYPMAGIFPYTASLSRSLRALGYCETQTMRGSIFGEGGTSSRGHVFHWAELDREIGQEDALFLIRKGERSFHDGLQYRQAVGSWVHFHFASNIGMLRSFIQKAGEYHER